MAVDDERQITAFLEKPADPPAMPGNPDVALASMGIYVFETRFLFEQLQRDAADPHSSHDFGKDIIPYLVRHGKALAHRTVTYGSLCQRREGVLPGGVDETRKMEHPQCRRLRRSGAYQQRSV